MPDRWLVVTIRPDPGADRGLLVDLLVALGGRAVEERDGVLVTHVPPPDDPDAFVHEVRERLHSVAEGGRVEWRWQPHEAWEETWRRGLAPRKVTDRIVVAPTWSEPDIDDGDVVIRLDPGVAFGTAEHATTRGALRLLESVLRPGDRVLDVGSGTGILAVAAVLLGAGRAVAVEADPYACEAAVENIRRNGVDDRVSVREERVDAAALGGLERADGVVANIDGTTLTGLLPGFRRVLAGRDGWLVVSGVRDDEREAFVRSARTRGFELGEALEEEGWWSGVFTLPSRADPGSPAPRAGAGSTGREPTRSRDRSRD